MPPSSPNASPSRRPSRRPDERGATLVEVAIVLPVFLLLIFGIMEFSYAATQNAEVRHVAGEGARAAAVGDNVSQAICGNLVVMDSASYSFASGSSMDNGGQMLTLQVSAPFQSLTGLVPGGWNVVSEHVFYREPNVASPAGGGCT